MGDLSRTATNPNPPAPDGILGIPAAPREAEGAEGSGPSFLSSPINFPQDVGLYGRFTARRGGVHNILSAPLGQGFFSLGFPPFFCVDEVFSVFLRFTAYEVHLY